MSAIILEGVLFVALLATAVTLFLMVLLRFTPLGTLIRQARNRHTIDRQAELTCPIHGLQDDAQLVRLPDGSSLCPQCYKEAVHG